MRDSEVQRSMKLYYGLTNYHLLCSILHKFIYNSKQETAFFASQGILKSRIDILKDLKIFDKIYYLEDTPLRDEMFNQLVNNSQEKNIKNITNEFIRRYEKILPFNLNEFDDFYLSADHGVFGIYILMKKIRYTYLEDGRGIYSNWEVLDNLLKIKNPGIRIMSLYYRAYGRNDLIKNKYISFDSQKSDCDLSNCIDFDVDYLLSKLSNKQLKSILTVFNVKNYNINSNQKNALVLTQRFSTYKMLENDECVLLYALLCDIFAKDCKVFLKPHPADKAEYCNVFENEILIDKEMPSELIKFIIKKKFDIGICTFSTSINSLKKHIKQIYNFDESIVTFKKDLFKIYALYEIAIRLNASVVNENSQISKSFDKAYKLNSEKDNIIFNYSNSNIKGSILVSEEYFNEANMVIKINKKIKNRYLPVTLLNDQELIYIKVESNEVIKKMKSLKINNILPISQLYIHISINDINWRGYER